MPETFMKAVQCPMWEPGGPPLGEEGCTSPSGDMQFQFHRGPYAAWWDDKHKRTIHAAEVGSRCVREFWICSACMSIRWFNVLIDLKMGDLPPEERDAWRKRLVGI